MFLEGVHPYLSLAFKILTCLDVTCKGGCLKLNQTVIGLISGNLKILKLFGKTAN